MPTEDSGIDTVRRHRVHMQTSSAKAEIKYWFHMVNLKTRLVKISFQRKHKEV